MWLLSSTGYLFFTIMGVGSVRVESFLFSLWMEEWKLRIGLGGKTIKGV